MKNSICVADFCGSYKGTGYSIYPFQYWADWFPEECLTRFGGRWADVPDMPGGHEPSETELDAWARQHGGFYFTGDEKDCLGAAGQRSLASHDDKTRVPGVRET